ncbi:CopG family transcriptional regulator [Nocardia camponoti]|uniref:Toxin-antitoxin system HicB family antitoxin n=1 Tax=Nocardia camponoti TaxID=1616106 RepID=A0A917QG24_9NOCA|nr:CopG family transcriptional regulator [Nocardia camponoti]GGK47344.1 hypothetical protein GCM10011591_18310 [Nocardia camponoti]
MRELNLRLPDDLHEHLVEVCSSDGTEVNTAIVEAVQAWVAVRAARAAERARLNSVLADDPELRALLGDE